MIQYLNLLPEMPKKENIQKMFDDIAPEYDKLNHIMSFEIDRRWRKTAVSRIIDKDRKLEILDVACGTGDFSIEIARKAKQGSHITGVDISAGMLEIGNKKVEENGLSGTIQLEQGDCEHLRFTDATFDRVSVAFGVRNFENLEAGLKEMRRVLKSGGKAVILELSVPENRFLLALYKIYAFKILPAIGGAISGNKGAYEYLPASVLKFPGQEKFKNIISGCGFRNIKTRSFTFGACRMYIGEKE